mgnify:CR=1 FL=1
MYASTWENSYISVKQVKAVKHGFRKGQKIRLIEQGSRKSKRYIRGRVIASTKYFITIMVSKNGIERYPESFKYVDFILGVVQKLE